MSGASLDYDVYISKQVGKIYKDRVFNQTITADVKPCEWLSVATWEFTPDAGNYLLNGRVYKVMSDFSISNKFFSVLPETPLKQFNSGIPFDETQCKDNLVLIQKYDGSPACVQSESIPKLIDRGWTATTITLENNSLTAEEEVSLAQSHYDKIYAANLEKMALENSNSTIVTEQAKTDRILELEAIISDETKILEDLQIELQKKYALDPDFKKQKERATEILRSTPDSDNIPYLGMTLGEDRQSLVIGIDSLKLTAEKDQQYYEHYIEERFAEITYPIKIVFYEPRGGDE